MAKSTNQGIKNEIAAMNKTIATYTNESGKSFERMNKSLTNIALGIKSTNQECKDAHYFLALRLYKTDAYGNYKNIKDFIIKSMGLKEDEQIKQFRNVLAYKAKKGAALLGIAPTAKSATMSPFDVIKASLNNNAGDFSDEENRELISLISDLGGYKTNVKKIVANIVQNLQAA